MKYGKGCAVKKNVHDAMIAASSRLFLSSMAHKDNGIALEVKWESTFYRGLADPVIRLRLKTKKPRTSVVNGGINELEKGQRRLDIATSTAQKSEKRKMECSRLVPNNAGALEHPHNT